MNIIAVDDERAALWTLEQAIFGAAQNAAVSCFTRAPDALDYARQTPVDVAFLDIEMADMNGLLLAKRLKDIRGATNIIFVTGHNRYSVDAFAQHASGYVLKPINPRRVAVELENLRSPVPPPNTGLRIQCFGHFEVFAAGRPVAFARSKSKEILAYLVDRRGAGVSKRELAAVLWEDQPYTRSKQIQLQTLIAELLHALKEAGAEDLIIKRRGVYALDTQKVNCDFYRYLAGDAAAVNQYRGEYMANYSWAEFTAGALAGAVPLTAP